MCESVDQGTQTDADAIVLRVRVSVGYPHAIIDRRRFDVETKLIAVCGITCTECPAYVATQSGEDAALARVAAEWSKEYDAEISAEDCRCNGCLSTEGPWMSHCSECKMRACGMEKMVENCAHCTDYVCEKLTEFFGFVPKARETLDTIRSAL